jgi:hypothetical protein
MIKECPCCSKELEACITFSRKEFHVCFDCNYMTEPRLLDEIDVAYFDAEEGD